MSISKRSPQHAAFAQLIVLLRKQRKLSQEKLAERCGRSQQWISKVETMETDVPIWDLDVLARGLGMEENDLFKAFQSARDTGVIQVRMPIVPTPASASRESRKTQRHKGSGRRRH